MRPRQTESVVDALLARQDQALLDLTVSGLSEVVFLRGAADALEPTLEQMARRARRQGLLSASVSMFEAGLDRFDEVVRRIAHDLSAGHRGEPCRGWLALVAAFVKTHGRHAEALFDARLAERGLAGDLVTLTRALIASSTDARREVRDLEAWLGGTSLLRVAHREPVAAPLSVRTARRSLVELTHLAEALGHRGVLIIFRDAEALAALPAARRATAYTLLRELTDDNDGSRGMRATRIVVAGGDRLFEGKRSIAELAPLALRVLGPAVALAPHHPYWELDARHPPPRTPVAPDPEEGSALRYLIRLSHGLPPIESVPATTVKRESIDKTIDELFEHASMNSSVFALLRGAYGAGKTHLLLHLGERALSERRPLLRLSLERLDADLGNPQRHLRRLLAQSTLPLPGRPAPLEQLLLWTRSEEGRAKLLRVVAELAGVDDEVGESARRLQRRLRRTRDPRLVLESYLGASDLVTKSANLSNRHDAYGRLLLWLALLERIESCAGPVLLIDEAENLYAGATRAERRTALRSLSFYCGGVLPRACVVMAVTPEAYEQLNTESVELLDEISKQRTVLASEDALMLRRRLSRTRPIDAPVLERADRAVLLDRTRDAHERVRGTRVHSGWTRFVEALIATEAMPRELLRRAVDHLETAWWTGRSADN